MALITNASNASAVLVAVRRSMNVIASYMMGSGANRTLVKCYDRTVTTVEEYHGFDEATAKSYAASLESNSMSDYCIRSSSTSPYSWIVCPLAKGTIVTADVRRNGNSRMFTVVKTTEVHTCSNSANWETYTP